MKGLRGRALPFALAAFATRPFNVLSNVASILGLVFAVAAIFAWDLSAIPLIYVCTISAFLLVRYVRHERWARYAEGVQVMERAFRRLTEASDDLFNGSKDSTVFFITLQGSLSAFAEAYTLVTGSNCRATIKELFSGEWLPPPDKRGGEVEPRDALLAGTVLRSEVDSGPAVATETAVFVDENSDFAEVFQSGEAFFSNDLAGLWRSGKYRNSHWHEDLKTTGNFPYRSAIVWPVRVDPRLTRREAPEKAVAFLCLDTKLPRAFVQGADVAFGAAYAHALYPALSYALKLSAAGRTRA